MNHLLHIVIPTHRRAELLDKTLASLGAAVHPAELAQVWVIENGDSRDAAAVCGRHHGRLPIRYEHRSEPGKAKALQWCIDRIGSGFVVFLDDDVLVDPGLLTMYAEASGRGPGHYFGGAVEPLYEEQPEEWLLPYLPSCTTGFVPDPTKAEQIFLGANMAAFAQDILRAGGFDLRFGPGARCNGTEGNPTGQETTVQQRLLDIGCQSIALPTARVKHHVPASHVQPAWALHRRYRNCVSAGMLQLTEVYGLRMDPKAGWRTQLQFLRAGLYSAMSCLARDPQTKFQMRLDATHLRGYLEGLRLSIHHAVR